MYALIKRGIRPYIQEGSPLDHCKTCACQFVGEIPGIYYFCISSIPLA
jgi:hypothetical protein